MRTLLILAVVAVIVMWALLVGGTIDDQPAVTPAPAVFHAESVFDPPPVIATTSSTTASTSTTTSTVVAARARTAPTHPSTGSVWDRVSACESGGRWDDTRGGYEGGVHFMHSTWVANGGQQFAPSANLATREQQIVIAKATLRRSSVHQQWPICGPKVGLTMADAA